MKKFVLLILCLLVACKAFSQTDTTEKTKYVFLTEEQAKANIKELMAFDALKETEKVLNKRISNFLEIIETYKLVVKRQDSIIAEKNSIIETQEKIIRNKKPIEFHSFAGAQFYSFDFRVPTFYYRTTLEFKKFNLGAQANFIPTRIKELPYLYFTTNIEIKIH